MYYITVICSILGWIWLLVVAGFMGGYLWRECVQKKNADRTLPHTGSTPDRVKS